MARNGPLERLMCCRVRRRLDACDLRTNSLCASSPRKTVERATSDRTTVRQDDGMR